MIWKTILITTTVILISSIHSFAQGKSSNSKVIENSWVKFVVPESWREADYNQLKVPNRDFDINGNKYVYWACGCFDLRHGASVFIEKLSYPDKRPADIETGKSHFTRHAKGLIESNWQTISNNEIRGRARVKNFKYDNGVITEPLCSQVNLIRKVDDDIYILKIRFEDGYYTDEEQNAIADNIIKSWQPLVKNK